MKYLITSITAILLISIGFGQNESSTQRMGSQQKTLMKNTKLNSVFIGFNVKSSMIANQEAVITGVELSLGFGKRVNIGLQANGLTSKVWSGYTNNVGTPLKLQLAYGGLLIEPIIGYNKIIHLTAPILLGTGVSTLSSHDFWDFEDGHDFAPEYHHSQSFLIAEPGLNLEVNVFKVLRVGIGLGHRFTTNTDFLNDNGVNLNGWTGKVSLKLGWF